MMRPHLGLLWEIEHLAFWLVYIGGRCGSCNSNQVPMPGHTVMDCTIHMYPHCPQDGCLAWKLEPVHTVEIQLELDVSASRDRVHTKEFFQ